ncbi:hypothetical protein AA103581_1687 [Gluconobacter wancherniae NBRC 103581]|nr:hypothetical protein AA103581_1687 [Gluconobacter wancherniae NBRC 103581]
MPQPFAKLTVRTPHEQTDDFRLFSLFKCRKEKAPTKATPQTPHYHNEYRAKSELHDGGDIGKKTAMPGA